MMMYSRVRYCCPLVLKLILWVQMEIQKEIPEPGSLVAAVLNRSGFSCQLCC